MKNKVTGTIKGPNLENVFESGMLAVNKGFKVETPIELKFNWLKFRWEYVLKITYNIDPS